MEQVTEAGSKGRKYNGIARRPIEALEAAGLVNVDWDMRPVSKGSGIELVWSIRVTPKEQQLCDNCHKRPVARAVTLGDTPTSLCQECFSGIEGVVEDEQGV